MLLGNAPADVESESQPGEAAVVYIRAAVKALEESGDISRRNADSAIHHVQACLGKLPPHANRHVALAETELCRIVDQMFQELSESVTFAGVPVPETTAEPLKVPPANWASVVWSQS